MNRFLTHLICALLLSAGSHAFVHNKPRGSNHAFVGVAKPSSSTALNGLFDFFSEDARKEREAKREREIAEQEKLQRQILERRANPEKMEEYEARVAVRRRAIMEGASPDSVKVMIDDDDE